MKYNFGESSWYSDFDYAYSLVAGSFNKFTQNSDHIANSYNEEIRGYDYISIVHKNEFKKGARIKTVCSFDGYGAPLITIANTVVSGGEYLRYGDHYEVVAYENGCNIWHIIKAPEGSEKPYKVTNCLRLRFPIADASRIMLEVEVLDKKLCVKVNDVDFDIPAPLLSDTFRLGITACEGINRFYSAEITE